jgi:5-methylcytosine-specific restriction endonuclease McrA
MLDKICSVCLKVFKVFPYREKARFCSFRCRSKVIMPPRPDRTGAIPWNKGLIKDVEPRLAIMGFQLGERNFNWRGGVTPRNKKIRSSYKWRKWRKAVFERDNFTCQDCKVRGGYLEPHHIKCFAHFPKLIFNVNNGVTLCKDCHKKTKNYGSHKKEICI